MKQVIAMHGWSGDKATWQRWENLFKRHDWLWINGERGYGKSTPSNPAWHQLPPNGERHIRAVIGHSLGLHLLASEVVSHATHVVMVGSFGRFIPNTPEKRIVRKALKKMQEMIGTTEETMMLKNFLIQASNPLPLNSTPQGPINEGISIEGRQRLKADLELLANTDGLPNGLSANSKVLVVEGQEDAIVIPSTRNALIEDLKKHLDCSPTRWVIPGAGHSLVVDGLIERVHNWLEKTQ